MQKRVITTSVMRSFIQRFPFCFRCRQEDRLQQVHNCAYYRKVLLLHASLLLSSGGVGVWCQGRQHSKFRIYAVNFKKLLWTEIYLMTSLACDPVGYFCTLVLPFPTGLMRRTTKIDRISCHRRCNFNAESRPPRRFGFAEARCHWIRFNNFSHWSVSREPRNKSQLTGFSRCWLSIIFVYATALESQWKLSFEPTEIIIYWWITRRSQVCACNLRPGRS